MPSTIENPVLRGFYPDPSFLRVGDDYYLANSTFEWWPGVPIHRSRDLVDWRLAGHALTRTSQLDLVGVPDSGGVWAPSLSWADGLFWLVYTNVRWFGMARPFKDHHNYLVTAPSVEGPWSEPVYLNSHGFDAELFHDDDGRKWVSQIQWDYRDNRPRFGGILLQEYDPAARRVVGQPRTVLQKETLIEGPNLYKKDGWYYLLLAEGGTGWNHSISMARSRALEGPYETDPFGPFLTARHDPDWPLQKAGHGELVQTPEGDWWLAHLCSRPWGPERRCVLGRETALQRVVWTDDGWARLAHGDVRPAVSVPAPVSTSASASTSAEATPATPATSAASAWRDDFDAPELARAWQSLRSPMSGDWLDRSSRPGWLRMRGRESAFSLHEQSLLAVRLDRRPCRFETCMEFAPERFTQMAGLVAWYDTRTHYFLNVRGDDAGGIRLSVTVTDDGDYTEPEDARLAVTAADWPRFYLRAEVSGETLRFSASPDGVSWQAVGGAFDATKLSDDYGAGLHFTGAFVGLCARDLGMGGGDGWTPGNAVAEFDYFAVSSEAFCQ